ncbi:MAG: hypothetical protein GY884_26470 [Proteobacteria bacterium]|nr:hypothetical protein [Pseudomonadota bacterium]
MNSIIKKSQVQYQGSEVRGLPSLGNRTTAGHERSLRVVEVAGVPRAIEVTCNCGDTFMIELDYEEDQR